MPYINPDLNRFERRVTSQFGEDGVIEAIAGCLSVTTGTFFEFGIGPPKPAREGQDLEGCFLSLRNKGWAGVFLDGSDYPAHFGVRKEFVTPLNINHLYHKHGLTSDLDFMSIDVDGQDFWIWMALQPRPKVMVIEINGGLSLEQSITVQFDVNHVWDGTMYHGASLRALDRLGKAKGYTLVWSNGVNAIFVRDDLVSNREDFSIERLYRPNTPHPPDPKDRPWVEV